MDVNSGLADILRRNQRFFRRLSPGDWQRIRDIRERSAGAVPPGAPVPADGLSVAVALAGTPAEQDLYTVASALSAAGHRVIAVGPAEALSTVDLGDALRVDVPAGDIPDRMPPADVILAAKPALLPGLYAARRPLVLITADEAAARRQCQRPEQLLLADAVCAPASDLGPALASLAASPVRRPGLDRRPTISLCMIVKNEEKMLPRLLTSAYGAVDEIIVVDTGSTDATAEVALRHGARLSRFDWIDDFAAARNASLDRAGGDWILIADADEELTAELRAELREAATDDRFEGYVQMVRSITGRHEGGQMPVVRFIRNRPTHRFEGIIHEQIAGSVLKSGRLGKLRSPLLHYGYSAAVITDQRKRERNMRLLQRAHQAQPDNLYIRYQLAHEHFLVGDYCTCLNLLDGLLERLRDRPLVYGYCLVEQTRALNALERYNETIELGMSHRGHWRSFPDAAFQTALAALSVEDYGLVLVIADELSTVKLGEGEATAENFQGQESLDILRGRVASARREWDSALKHYTAAVGKRADSFSSCYPLAAFVVHHAEPEQAFSILSSMPFETKEFLVAVAYAYLTRGHLSQARDLATGLRLLRIETPLDADILFCAGDWRGAAAGYESSNNPGGLLRWAMSLALLEDHVGLRALSDRFSAQQFAALEQFATGKPCGPDTTAQMKEIFATLLSFSRLPEFIAMTGLLASDGNEARIIAAKLLTDAELDDEAAALLAEAGDVADCPWACGFLARYLWSRGDRDGALPFLMRRLDQPGCPVGVYVRLSDYLTAAGDRNAAREVLSLGRSTYPHSPELSQAQARFNQVR